jgi:hypothetical protein
MTGASSTSPRWGEVVSPASAGQAVSGAEPSPDRHEPSAPCFSKPRSARQEKQASPHRGEAFTPLAAHSLPRSRGRGTGEAGGGGT